jgi:hypothetical protein
MIKMSMRRKVQVLGRSMWRKILQRDRRRYLNWENDWKSRSGGRHWLLVPTQLAGHPLHVIEYLQLETSMYV